MWIALNVAVILIFVVLQCILSRLKWSSQSENVKREKRWVVEWGFSNELIYLHLL